MTQVILEKNRRNLNFATSKVREVLPEYYVQEYPKLVSFLENYYNYLDSDTPTSFKREINNLFAIRDISETEIRFLDLLVSEIGNGLQAASFFEAPRLMASLLAQFYRSKGSLVSVEGFFRAFYNSEVDIEYPKSQIFIVGESEIGSESLRFIIDDRLYQTFSILIKSGISVADYEQLYKRFVHPAGFYFAGQVLMENEVSLGLVSAPGIENPLDSASNLPVYTAEAFLDPGTGFSQLTGLYDSDGQKIRVSLDELLDAYQNLSSTDLSGIYDNLADLVSANSFKFDDSSDPVGPDTSLTLERMDASMFTRYTSDSSY